MVSNNQFSAFCRYICYSRYVEPLNCTDRFRVSHFGRYTRHTRYTASQGISFEQTRCADLRVILVLAVAP